jgi:hypothetical protein
MNKILFSLLVANLLIIVGTSACNLPAAPNPQTPTSTPSETATPKSTPTETEIPASATPELAQLCQPDTSTNASVPSTCQLPMAQAGSTFCEKKNPYNLVYINQGSTYEVLTRGFDCTEAGLKNGKQLLTCTGIMASGYELRVCDAACAIPTVQADVKACPQGFNYNDLQGCCTQDPIQIGQNCTVLKLETITCVVDCSVYKKRAWCNANSNACVWDAETKSCLLRQ